MSNNIESLRHLSVFTPSKFGKTRVDVIGVGATGSKIALELAKLGIENLHIWDDDIVESHNIANQAFTMKHIGKPKVEAVAEMVKESTGLDVHVHNKKVESKVKLGDFVFLLVDSMKTRKDIWDKTIKMNASIKFMLETRMGKDQGMIFAVNPIDPDHIKNWEETYYPDEESQESLCRSPISIGATSSLVSSAAVWQFINWYRVIYENDNDIPIRNEMIISTRTGEAWNRIY